MAKLKRAYVCTACGYDTPKWLGKCPSCGEWNTIVEHVVAKESSSVASRLTSVPRVEPRKVQDIEEHNTVRVDVGIKEVNRVLGGGMVPGSLILLPGRRSRAAPTKHSTWTAPQSPHRKEVQLWQSYRKHLK